LIFVVAVFGSLCALHAQPGAPSITDVVAFGTPASERAHDVTSSGDVKCETIATELGTLRDKYAARTVSGSGSALTCTLKVDRYAKTPLILEIEEIHIRRPQAFGYTVAVGGKVVYFRTYEEMGGGPNHYFVQCNGVTAHNGRIKLTFRSVGDAPFSVAKVWAYSDFFALAKAEAVYQKMPICENPQVLLGAPNYDPAKSPGVSAAAYDNQLWKTLKARFAPTPYLPGKLIFITYALNSEASSREMIDKEVARAAELDVNYQIVFSGGEWAAHPMGPDGLGGYFSDVNYSQIWYDKATKTYRTTWPDSAGAATWPTWNNPQLRKFLTHRLAQTAGYYVDRLAFMKAGGQSVPDPLVCQDWGLSYWVNGDCNDGLVGDAKKDGVTLTPENGLDHTEKMWMLHNLSRVPSRAGEAFRSTAGRDSVLLDRGVIRLPDQQTSDQFYFHTYYEPVYPLWDDRWALWQAGVGPHVWATGETLPQLPSQYYDYVMARGKLACVNLERSALPNMDYVQTLYQRGFQVVTLSSTRPGDADLFIPQSAHLDEKPCDPPVHCERNVFDVYFMRDEAFGPPGRVVDTQNVSLTLNLSYPYDKLRAIEPNKPGHVTYRLTNNGRPFGSGVKLTVTGTLTQGDGYFEVAVGNDPTNLHIIRTVNARDLVTTNYYPWKSTATVDLGDSVRGLNAFYMRIIIHAAHTVINATIEKVQVSLPWDMTSGHVGGEPFTVKQMRTLHLWIQDRAVCERLQADYRQLAGEDAIYRRSAALASQGRYRSAYRVLAGEISLLLPARFAVRGHGKLGRYPLNIELAGDDNVALVDLRKAGPNEFEFALKTERKQSCRLQIDRLPNGRRYAVHDLGANHYRITPAEANVPGLKVADGRLAMNFTIVPVDDLAHRLPQHLSGVYLDGTAEGMWIDVQDPGLWMDNPIFAPISKSVKLTRFQQGVDGSAIHEWPHKFDKLDMVLDNAGVAQDVTALYGKDSGRIKAFYPPRLKGDTSNGVIELDNGHRYEFSNMWFFTELQVPHLASFIRMNRSDGLVNALTPGSHVDLTFCPYTYAGRLPRVILLTMPTVGN
jgi:hypothetical protein